MAGNVQGVFDERVFQPTLAQAAHIPEVGPAESMNDVKKGSRLHFLGKFVQTILWRPVFTALPLTARIIKLLTWDLTKAGFYKVSGYHAESATHLEMEYLHTLQALRDLVMIPSIAKRAWEDMVGVNEEFIDDLPQQSSEAYLNGNVSYVKKFQQFSSYLHGLRTFDVSSPVGISEFEATSDASLKTVMASHIFKPGMMAINFGSPNVATFVTEEGEGGSVQTIKVDAKSLKRAPMTYHATGGKMQSGVFFVPTNLPVEALERFKVAADQMQGRSDITCVNTNCRVLQEAGFSIEGVAMDGVIFPTTFIEHLLFRNVFYTDLRGKKHKIHFNILNTTPHTLEEYVYKIDLAVVGTQLRHSRRAADTEENKNIRGTAAKALIAQERERLAQAVPSQPVNNRSLGKRTVTVSVPSFFGDTLAQIWGRHTMYEVNLSDKREEIARAFAVLAPVEGETIKLRPFPQPKPSFGTRIKRDVFFSGPAIRFLRRHMMGRADKIHLHTQDLFNHLTSTNGALLNYVILDDKVVFAQVQANGNGSEAHRRVADWALSKHALLSGRQDVYCTGQIWYDRATQKFKMDNDSGTYIPSFRRVELAAELANNIFDTDQFVAVDKDQPVG